MRFHARFGELRATPRYRFVSPVLLSSFIGHDKMPVLESSSS